VHDVVPYQEMKLRLLNGPHSAIAYLGALLGKQSVAEVMADPMLARFVERLMREEILACTPIPPRFDAESYIRALLQRFANRSLNHRTLQIAMDGSQKIPVRWLPTLREARRRGMPVPGLVVALAAWLRFLGGRDEAGRDLPLDDPLATRLRAVAAGADGDPAALVRTALAVEEVFGQDLRQDAGLIAELTRASARIAREGLRAVLAE
jgi:fructuronate reductase